MFVLENIRLSLKGIWSHKMRSVLTMLGVIIGIASIITIIGLINGASNMLMENVSGEGTNTLSLELYDVVNNSYEAYDVYTNGTIDGLSTISQEKLDAIREIDGVTDLSVYYKMTYVLPLVRNDTDNYGRIYGVEKNYFKLTDYRLKRGRLFTQEDYDNKNNVIILDSSYANDLFGNSDWIGRTVTIGSSVFVVVGVIDTGKDDYDSLLDYENNSGGFYQTCFVPYTSWSLFAGYDNIQELMIAIEDLDDKAAVSTAAGEILNSDLPSSDYEYKSQNIAEEMAQLQQITNVISILLVGIASISLLVGGVGVMNIMLVSVTERTREIGLKKALGAKKGKILGQFLTEAAVLTSLGGIIGVVLGLSIAKIIGSIVKMQVYVSPLFIVISVLFSMFVGIVFGLVPSRKAANMDPIEALRYE